MDDNYEIVIAVWMHLPETRCVWIRGESVLLTFFQVFVPFCPRDISS